MKTPYSFLLGVMPRGSHLSAIERGQIIAYNKCGKTSTEIGRLLCRDQQTISRFLKNVEAYGQKSGLVDQRSSLTLVYDGF
jgi:IS30 family transposase